MSTDPFTRTPGIAGTAYIDMHYSKRIIDDFGSDESYKYVYKIVGLRGSGKSVEYSKIINYFRKDDRWLVYTLAAGGNPTESLIALLSKEEFIDDKKYTTAVNAEISLGGKAVIIEGGTKAGVSKISEQNSNYYTAEVALEEMLKKATENGYKILVGIDDIAKSAQMVKFLSVIGKIILEQSCSLYFLCTGIAENIEEVSNEDNLTFFKRSDLIEIAPLNRYEVADKYRKLLDIDIEEANALAKFVKGYAYAYQVLGSLYFNKKTNETLEDIVYDFDKVMFRDSYELIWDSLTEAEKQLVISICDTDTGKVADIKEKMEKPGNFSVLRERLDKKHLLCLKKRGYVSIELPRFKEFVEMWGE